MSGFRACLARVALNHIDCKLDDCDAENCVHGVQQPDQHLLERLCLHSDEGEEVELLKAEEDPRCDLKGMEWPLPPVQTNPALLHARVIRQLNY